jgi:hypothetical protein
MEFGRADNEFARADESLIDNVGKRAVHLEAALCVDVPSGRYPFVSMFSLGTVGLHSK